MRKCGLYLAAALVMTAPSQANAIPDIFGVFSNDGIEAIAVEAPGCRYCELFRQDVLPTYASTPTGKKAPLRFVDVSALEGSSYRLTAPVSMVPTVILVKNGVELGRIPGYVGRQNFYVLMDALLRE